MGVALPPGLLPGDGVFLVGRAVVAPLRYSPGSWNPRVADDGLQATIEMYRRVAPVFRLGMEIYRHIRRIGPATSVLRCTAIERGLLATGRGCTANPRRRQAVTGPPAVIDYCDIPSGF